MFEVTREVRVAALPQAVWRAVTDFAAYRAWTKPILLDGEPKVGSTVSLQIAGRMRSGVQRAIRHEGTIKAVTPERDLVWTSGIPGVIRLRFGLDLRPAGSTSEVRYSMQFSGFAAYLFRGRLTRLYGPILSVVAEDLARHLGKGRAASLRIAPDIRRRRRKTQAACTARYSSRFSDGTRRTGADRTWTTTSIWTRPHKAVSPPISRGRDA